jgi:hypothetical protein
MRKGQTDAGKAWRAQFIGVYELEDALDQEHQTHKHPDKNHGKISAHPCLRELGL